jgi:hypothetical protein
VRYITQSLLDHVRDELKYQPIDKISSGLGFDTDHLARLLDLPFLQPIPTDDDAPFDLFEATERLQSQL